MKILRYVLMVTLPLLVIGAGAYGAQKLIDYLLEAEAQGYFAQETYEYPVVAGVEPYEGLPALSSLNPPKMDLNDLSDLETAVKLLREVDALP